MNLLEILNFSKEYLEKASIEKARLESEKVLSFVLKIDRIGLYAHFDRMLFEEEKNQIKFYLKTIVEEKKSFDDIKKDLVVDENSYREENYSILNKSIEYLAKYGVPNPKLDAEYIFANALGVNRMMLSLNLNRQISQEKKNNIRLMVMERGSKRRPLQYILGEWEFFGNTFVVDERVLIPRNDTEILVEQCKYILLDMKKGEVLDIGCGSGAISISLGKELPNFNILGIDISEGALEVSEINKEINKTDNVSFRKSNIFSELKGNKFNMIISNPPYISENEYDELMVEVKEYEPKMALTDGGTGISFYKKISEESSEYLEDGGYLAFEVGYRQLDDVRAIMEKNNFIICFTGKDYSGNDRVIIGKKSGD
ncbi:peptide chain release factor N(5)-glutamine methyltransferase [Fusobacterium sp. PH5-44]|uniref:peptide chain release factor N(5)-glutamine methyltransferase n=1 Tax=unclassified Fusobacterium TaxID=2648384 RepID=UPI003D1FC31B